MLERRRVVAVRRGRREERRQVDQVRAERRDVVEVLLDAAADRRRRARTASACHGRSAARPSRAGSPTTGSRRRGARSRTGRGRSGRRPTADASRRPRAGGDDEVVGVRDLVRRAAERVHPGIAGVAARQEPAVARDRVPDRERRAPPDVGLGLLVDRRLDAARLAVALVPEKHPVRRRAVRDAQPDDRLVAELLRMLEDVLVRAVVMRLGEQAFDLGSLGQAHPLTEPAVSPLTIQRCRNMNSARPGSPRAAPRPRTAPTSCRTGR